ncbi:MAG: adenosine deaminase [Candidatus Melainabacteria bacterium]|nr:adenosine deaminase [Candidatus Melainabacteria bacterium]
MSLYADLHRHLGGAIHPRIIYKFLQRHDHPVLNFFPDYDGFYNWFTRPCRTLEEFVKIHTLVEELQSVEHLPYFCLRLCRGAYTFENLQYLELRYNPYFRTDKHLTVVQRIDQMNSIVEVITANCRPSDYPIVVKQILCLDRRLPKNINEAILKVARDNLGPVVGVDLAGPEIDPDKWEMWVRLMAKARSHGLKTTAHLGETGIENVHSQYLAVLDRIGHGIHIPLLRPEMLKEIAKRQITLEVCPTSYRQTGVMKDIGELKDVFGRCREAGVAIAVCTDNPGRNPAPCTLPGEYERLIDHDVIEFCELKEIQNEAFRSAFGFVGTPRL